MTHTREHYELELEGVNECEYLASPIRNGKYKAPTRGGSGEKAKMPILWAQVILLLSLRSCLAVVCPAGTGAVFFALPTHRQLEISSHCFEHCSTANCTGVLLYDKTCVSLNADDVYGLLDETKFFRKNCIAGAKPASMVRVYQERFLDSGSEKIVEASSELHCLSICFTEKNISCESVIFFADSNDCLLNTATSSSAKILPNDDAFHVVYMERQHRKSTTVKQKGECMRSFELIPWNKMALRGEARLVNVTGGFSKCLSLCRHCDYAIYNEYFSECFLVIYDERGQKFDFIDEQFQVFRRRAHKCLKNSSCDSVYWSNGRCVIAATKQLQPRVIERICPAAEEQDIAVLFEETSKCPKKRKDGISIAAIGLKDCMQLCLTHPTKSCEAISFYSNRECRLQNTAAVVAKPEGVDSTCRQFKLNVIAFDDSEKNSKPKKLKKKAKQVVRASKTHTSVSKDPKHSFGTSSSDVEVQTICNYDGIIVKVISSESIDGEVFPRNAHTNCTTVMNGTQAELKMLFNANDCALTKNGLVYENVIVVKRSNLDGMPVITEYDKLYRISCDYSNHTTKMSATSVLQVTSASPTSIQPYGKVRYSPMKMELRTKGKNEVRNVILGQNVDLKIDDDSSFGSNYTVTNCVALDSNGRENITLIDNGCVTRTAREYIVRGAITRESDGFSIPLRAFRFKDGDAVKIICSGIAFGTPEDGATYPIASTWTPILTRFKSLYSSGMTISLKVFGSDPVRTGCCTFLHRRDGVSDLGRENRGDDEDRVLYVSSPTRWRVGSRKGEQRGRRIQPAEDALGQVDVAIEEIGVEIVNDLLHGSSGRGNGSVGTSESGHLGLERLVRIDVHGQVRFDEDTNAAYSPAVACPEEQFFSRVVGGV
ncbi:unnamed protein product [Heligmosomoides polygyrus]|uniref:PAN domain protein n=1 Tax=Heligmosomoides polygyrus TaxID=6339 RepID=A0A183FV70_HELPZ|nr:unnamed protein product [Heligmosomoides polygyrus]